MENKIRRKTLKKTGFLRGILSYVLIIGIVIMLISSLNESASKQKKRNHEKIQLSIRISSGEHEQIKMNAQACGQSVSAYVKQNALSMQMIKPDQSVISENTAQLHEQRMAVMQLIYTIMKTETYVPADLEYILEKTKEMLKQQTGTQMQYLH